MMNVLFGTNIGILSIVTVVGAIVVVVGWTAYMFSKSGKSE